MYQRYPSISEAVGGDTLTVASTALSPSGGASKDPGRYLGRLLAEEALSEVPRLARRAPRRALASQYARTSLNRASRIAVIAAPRKSTVLNPKLLNLPPGSPCSSPRVAPP